MSRFNRPFRLALVVGLGLLLAPVPARAGFKRGDRLPDLASFDLEGKLPANVHGRVILLDFWASWCAPCKASFPAMEALHKRYRDGGLIVLAVSVDESRQNMERFVKSANVSFATARDANQKLVAAADAQTMPTSFLIDRAGRIRFVHPGFEGDQTVRQYNAEIQQLLKEPAP